MQLDRDIEAWADEQWPDADLAAKFRKLGEEVGELGEALARFSAEKERRRWALPEIADCGIILSHMARMLGAEGLYEIMEPVFELRVARDGEADVSLED